MYRERERDKTEKLISVDGSLRITTSILHLGHIESNENDNKHTLFEITAYVRRSTTIRTL